MATNEDTEDIPYFHLQICDKCHGERVVLGLVPPNFYIVHAENGKEWCPGYTCSQCPDESIVRFNGMWLCEEHFEHALTNE